MNDGSTFRPQRGGRSRQQPSSSEPPGWSATRTTISVVVLLVTVGTAWWLIRPAPPPQPEWWKKRDEVRQEDRLPAGPIDLAATHAAIRLLDRWPQMTWQEKREATRVVDTAFELGGTEYVEYVEVNRELILDHLESRARLEQARRATDSGQPDNR